MADDGSCTYGEGCAVVDVEDAADADAEADVDVDADDDNGRPPISALITTAPPLALVETAPGCSTSSEGCFLGNENETKQIINS